jgi:hypothetical protein
MTISVRRFLPMVGMTLDAVKEEDGEGKGRRSLPLPCLIYPEASVIQTRGRNLFLNLKVTAIIKRNLYLKIQGNTGGGPSLKPK